MPDVRESRLNEIYNLIRAYATKYRHKLVYLEVDAEDFVQDVILCIFRRKGLDNYDETKIKHGGFDALIFNIASRRMIDLHRAKFGTVARTDVNGRAIRFMSMQEPIGSEQEDGEQLCLGDLLKSNEEMATLVMEYIELVPEDQISPNYQLSWRELFRFSVEKGPDLIAREVGISESRIYQLQRELFRRFLPQYQRRFLDETRAELQAHDVAKQVETLGDPAKCHVGLEAGTNPRKEDVTGILGELVTEEVSPESAKAGQSIK